MTKTEQTKRRIVTAAAALFNQKGYAGTHIRDIMEATGLAKGGIYGNFASKEEIEVAAFDHAVSCTRVAFVEEMAREGRAPDKLHGILRIYERYLSQSPLPGGCPILNTAIEADDTHEPLRERVVAALDRWQASIAALIEEGKTEGSIVTEIDAQEYATHFVATIEGAIMLAKAYGDFTKLERALLPLHRLIDRDLSRGASDTRSAERA